MKKGLIVGSLSLLLAALSPQVTATTATSMSSWEDVEEPTDIYYPSNNRYVNDSYVNVTNPSSGTFKMELRYRNGGEWWDSGGHNDRGRAEVKGLGPHQRHGETYDYISTMKVNSTWRNTSRFAHVFQLFAVNGGSSVAYCVQMNLSGTQGSGKLDYRRNGTGSSIVARNFTFTNDVFATYRIRVKAGTSGYVGLSINGDAQQGGNISMQVSGADGFRPKWGLYRGFDPGMNIGDTHVINSNVQANKVDGTNPPSFSLSASPASQTVLTGASTTYNIAVTPANGFSGSVALSASGLPAGATASFSLASISTSGTSVLTIATSSSTPAGSSTITVSGLSSSLSANTSVSLSVTQPVAAAPTFSPAGGTYTSAQSVTISSATSAASIRYTLDGTTPTATTGTLYSGPVTISSTTTLKAIAFASGYTDSAVTSATYTISTVTGPVTLEAESLSYTTSGPTVTTGTEAAASGGVVTYFNATGANQWVQFTTPALAAGTYSLQFRFKANANRGQHTVVVDGVQVGGTIDEYASSSSYKTVTVGNVTLASSGTHTVRLTVTGKTSASGDYDLAPDAFTFTPTTPSYAWEAESLAFTAGGATASADADTGASGGSRVTLWGDGTGDYIEFTLPNVAAGTYQLRLTYKTLGTRGICNFGLDGTAIGGTLDQYGSSATFPTVTVATVTIPTAGNHTFRMTVTGKNSASTSYTLAADRIALVGQ
jgi:hypothetical protein